MITITRGIRVTTFDDSGTVLSVVDHHRSGPTEFFPAEVWADPEVVAEARARLAAVDTPRRRKARR